MGLGVGSILLMLLLYSGFSWYHHAQNPRSLAVPTWTQMGHALYEATLADNRDHESILWEDTQATASRLLTGLVVGVLLSVVLGLMMGCFSSAQAFFLPPLAFLAKVPATAVAPIFFVILGMGFTTFVTMLVFTILPTLAQSIYQSVKKDVPDELIYKAYTLGAHHGEVIWNVIARQVFPRIIDACRLQIGPAMVLLVAAEWFFASEGFGYRLRLYYQRTDMTLVFVYVALLGLVGFGADYGLGYLRRKTCPWFGD